MASHLALPFFTKQSEYREYDFNLFSVYYLLQLGGWDTYTGFEAHRVTCR